ncbi:hypothetical protein [Pseudonocardia ailaonensis]|uniref:hypothetical protein n=1 Tax=Pseudonocardia ailaonensis TaxID=367279 RepID=UPI0031E42B4F
MPPELAEVAERFGVHLRAGERVRFEVIDGGLTAAGGPPRGHLFDWVGSIEDAEPDLAENARAVLRAETGE